MPSYIELDKQALFPSSSNAGKVIFGVDNSGQATITDSAGQTTPVGGGGSINTGSFATTGSNTFTGNQTISGSIDFGGGSQIQSVSQSSGDGYGYTTLELNPDVNLGSDQYIVLDPTSPNHIHIRAGGIIDSSSAYLYLGGEKSNVVVRNLDNSFNEKYWVEINSQTGSTQNTWIFDEDGKLSMPGALEHGTSVVATGSYSHAEGSGTIASGSYSHAEGNGTIALGEASHAEGDGTIASGFYSHAEGEATQASGYASHAEGANTISSGSYSHAEGLQTQAIGDHSHAEGDNTQASGYASHAEGQTTTSSGFASHAEGYETISSGSHSHAEGQGTQAIGDYSHAEGLASQAIGDYSHAEGSNTQAIGGYSHTEGYETKTGVQTAYSASISNGIVTLPSSYGDVAGDFVADNILYLYDADFDDIYSWGTWAISQSYFDSTNTIVELYDTTTTTTTAYVGDVNFGISSWRGDQTIPGNNSHAEGESTLALGWHSHAEGTATQAISYGSHAEGTNTQTIGEFSHAEGYATKTIGNYSHAEGSVTQAIGDSSHAEGLGTVASGSYQHVQGKYNATSSIEGAFIVGNGTDDENRSNLIHAGDSTIEISGSVNISGSLTVNGSDLRPYKVYTALLTQNGSGSLQTINSGSLTIGVTYYITDRGTVNWDFTNVGALTNNVETYFVATGTTPNSWGNANLVYDTGAPVVTVLENTIGNIVWTYDSEGAYYANLTGGFIVGKTWMVADTLRNTGAYTQNYKTLDVIELYTFNNTNIQVDGLLDNTGIEIRVYN